MQQNLFTLSLCTLFAFVVAEGTAIAQLATSPADLASALRSKIEAKDLVAAGKLVEWGNAPIPAYRIFRMSIADCFTPAKCKLEIQPFDKGDGAPPPDYVFPVPPEGQLKLSVVGESDGFTMPFAKIGNEYRFVIGQLNADGYAQAKLATDARKVAEALDADLISSGVPLPADGGEPGKAFQRYLSAISSGDTAFLGEHGTAADRYFFARAFKDNPIKAGIALELTRLESIAIPTIKEGFQKESKALLLLSGTNALGWTSEGAVLLLKSEAGVWEMEDKSFQSYPPKAG